MEIFEENTTRPLTEWSVTLGPGGARETCPSCHTASAPGGRFPKAEPLVALRRARNPLKPEGRGYHRGGLRHPPYGVPCSKILLSGKNGLFTGFFRGLILEQGFEFLSLVPRKFRKK